ncbi:MAG: DUF4389 domain-containing protein [Candidatus Berkiellales bacterium]
MSTKIKRVLSKLGSKNRWFRGLYILLFIFICYIVAFVGFFVILFQFVVNLIFNKSNEHLQRFGHSLGVYAYEVISFLTYNTEQMPFPFNAWPSENEVSSISIKTNDEQQKH